MSRKRRDDSTAAARLDGVLVVDKPAGLTSHDVVDVIRRRLDMRKVGHTGTLDPDATGVLPLCLGRATKIVRFLINEDKEYEATLHLGVTTTTQDASGEVVDRRDVDVSCEDFQAVLARFTGEIQQIPPMVSAVHHEGKRLYQLARKGIEVPREPRGVTIHELVTLSCDIPDVTIRVACSKGTYIRTLCADIGEALGCGAHQLSLRRIRSGGFTVGQAAPLDDIGTLDDALARLIPIDRALDHIPAVRLKPGLEVRAGRGELVYGIDLADRPPGPLPDLVRIEDAAGRLVSVAQPDPARAGALKSVRVFARASRPKAGY